MRFMHIFLFLILAAPVTAMAEDRVIRIYQDADLSNHVESAHAIQKGIEVAFDEIGNEIAGYKVDFKYLDHRGNVLRSKRNYTTYLADPNGLVIYSGIHSPPLITNRAFINENKSLTLVPWAAGGPVTRYPSSDNWVFRLSVDDTQAGYFMVRYALHNKKCASPYLLLEESPWGASNLKSISKALGAQNIYTPNISRFNWNLQYKGARELARRIQKSKSDCIFLVSSAIEGAKIVQALIDIGLNIPVISHWGISAGSFHKKIPHHQRAKIDLSFIQSCFAFTNKDQTVFSKTVFERLKKVSQGTIEDPKDLRSAVGFIHAYDLTKLLIAAIKQTGLTGDVASDRKAIKDALENLAAPVQGLIKTYNKPFSVFDEETNFNAHEALSQKDYCMAVYGPEDEILILEKDI